MLGGRLRLCVACIVAATFSCTSQAWSICAPVDHQTGPSLPANQRVVAFSDGFRRDSLLKNETAVEDVSLHGGNAMVYDGFSGCGQSVQLAWPERHVRVSYAKTANAEPFARFGEQSFKREEFLDAELAGSLGTFGEAGATASMHHIGGEGDAPQSRTVGGRFRLSGFENQLALSSGIAVNGADTAPARSFAHHHELALRPLSFGSSTVSAAISFSEADADFQAERSSLEADRRVVSVEGKLSAGDADVEVTYIKAWDNVANRPDAPTTSWRDFGGRFSWNSIRIFGLPGKVALRGGLRDEQERSANNQDNADQTRLTRTWGANSRWGEPALFADLDVGGSFSIKRSHDGKSEQVRKRRIALELGAEDRRGTFQTTLFTEGERTEGQGELDGYQDLGWSLSANAGGQNLESSLTYRTDTGQERYTPWKWTVGAEIDALRLLAGRKSTGNWFALAEIKAEVENQDVGTRTDFRTMLSSGVRF